MWFQGKLPLRVEFSFSIYFGELTGYSCCGLMVERVLCVMHAEVIECEAFMKLNLIYIHIDN